MISEEKLDINQTLYKIYGYIHNIEIRTRNKSLKIN